MDNINIYELIGLESDPVYNQLSHLKKNEEIIIESNIIKLTGRFYEVMNEEVHEAFRDKISCYQFLNKLITANN